MTELMKWQMRDPAEVYERKQTAARAREIMKLKVDPFGSMWIRGKEVMTRDESEQIEELLVGWYEYEKRYRPALGAPRVSPYGHGVGGDSYGEPDDGIDARIAAEEAKAVGFCVEQLHWKERSALGLHMAHRLAGNQVMRNPRLAPTEDTHRLYQQAKLELLPLLRRRGLIRIAA